MTDSSYRPGPISGVSEEVQACIPQYGALHAYLWWASKTTHAPAWWHVGAGLALIAHEAARHGYTIGAELEEKPSLWVALVGPSAAGKSTAISRAMDFYQAHLERHQAYDPFVMAEGSIPGMFERITEGYNVDLDRTLGILHQDEFSRLLDTKQPVSEMLMHLADNRAQQRHLRGAREKAKQGLDAHDKLKSPCLSAIFATTYSNLRRITRGHHMEGGLYSRMIWFVDDPNPDALQMLPNKRGAERRMALCEWDNWIGWFHAEAATGGPLRVEIPDTVLSLLEASLFEQAKQHMGSDDHLNASRMRAITYAYRIAGLFALSCGRTTVLSEDMDTAVNCVERTQRGYARIAGELGENPIMQLVNVAFRAIQRHGTDGLGRSKLYPVLRTTKREVDLVIQTLLDEGSVRMVEQRTGKRGRPSVRYVACGPERFTGESEDVVSLHGPRDTPVDVRPNGE